MTELTNFMGIPIEGEIVHGHDQTKQRPIKELQAEIVALLDYGSFTKLRWRQYTPYFSDGDPCVFSVHEAYLQVPPFTDEDEEAGDYGDGFVDPQGGSSYNYLSDAGKEWLGQWVSGKFDYETRSYPDAHWAIKPKHPKMITQAEKVCSMLGSGAFNTELLRLFGDHAVVTLSQEKIEIEYYEHD